jgi:hypothetical protein
MESEEKIERLLEKYFDGETSLSEEKELKAYFASGDVAQHLAGYGSLFGYFAAASEQAGQQPLRIETPRRRAWLSLAASAVILLGAGTYTFLHFNTAGTRVQREELGTYKDPEVAFRETQKALELLSAHVNKGVESMGYLQQYEQSKNVIFKK